MSELALSADELRIVRGILAYWLPPKCRAYVFGSRATRVRLKPWSDLDLALEAAEPLPTCLIGNLDHAFDESLLPMKVDVVDLMSVSPEFRRIVDATKVPLPTSDDL